MVKKIYVSPSDQTKNTYAAGNTNENDQCEGIASALVLALQRCGFEARTNLSASMADRVREGNAWKSDLYVAVHTNAFNEEVAGTRIFSYDLKGEGYKAAKSVFDILAPITPGTSENIKARPELYEVRNSKAPCVYIEVDFHDVDEVALWIIENTTEIAEAIAEGICNYFGMNYKAGKESDEMRYKTLGDLKADKNFGGAYLPTVEKLMDKGILKGKSGEGDETVIDLGEDAIRVLVILDRAGQFGE